MELVYIPEGHIYAPATYAEVKVNGKRRLIEVIKRENGRVTGYRANRDGSRWDRDDGKTWTQEIIVVSSDSVERYFKFELTFGEMIEIK
jgi:hypothetical protein